MRSIYHFFVDPAVLSEPVLQQAGQGIRLTKKAMLRLPRSHWKLNGMIVSRTNIPVLITALAPTNIGRGIARNI